MKEELNKKYIRDKDEMHKALEASREEGEGKILRMREEAEIEKEKALETS